MLRHAHWALLFAALGCGSTTTPTETPATAPEPAPAPAEPAAEPAHAAMEVPPERAIEVKLPTGKTMTADHVTAPAEGTIEAAVVASITQIAAGDFDGWIATWCHDSACGDPEKVISMKTYTLPAAQGTSKQCLDAEGTGVIVTRRDPPEADGMQRVYVFCGEQRMPAPSAHYLVDGKWKVASISW